MDPTTATMDAGLTIISIINNLTFEFTKLIVHVSFKKRF